MVFVDPASLTKVQHDSSKQIFSFLLMLFGIVVSGFIISVLSSSLENTFRDIRGGRLKYNGSEHTMIINYNHKVPKILDELNILNKNHGDIHDVVILISEELDVQKLQYHISELEDKLKHLKILIRFGDVLSMKRYEELSILNLKSIIVLSDDNIKDPFIRDNHSIRIVSLLCTCSEFMVHLRSKKEECLPVKAVVELENVDRSSVIIDHISSSLFLAISPSHVLTKILNLSMINIDFYNVWSQLLSFEGYEFYFVCAKDKNLVGSSYKDVLLKHKQGVLLALSRSRDKCELDVFLNDQKEIIREGDWLLFMAKDKHSISFKDEKLKYTAKEKIIQPSEIYTKKIVIIGNAKQISDNQLLDDISKIEHIIPSPQEYTSEEFYNDLVETKDTIIINLDDERIYRLALALKEFYKDNIPEKFVFLIDDTNIASQLESAGIENIILSHNLISKYIAQVANQLLLYKVFDIIFTKNGAEVNFILVELIPTHLLDDVENLKIELVNENMVYLGCENNDGTIVFEATNLSDAKKIIVFADGES